MTDQIYKLSESYIKWHSTILNVTISPAPRKYTDFDSYYLENDIKNCLHLAFSKNKKIHIECDYIFVKESFPNNRIRTHYHGQLYLTMRDKKNSTPERTLFVCDHDLIDKIYGLFQKKLGNTMMRKNMPKAERDLMLIKAGLPTGNEDYPEYIDYMVKEVKDRADWFHNSLQG